MTNCYKEGYVPPEALSWNDADDNNAYHEKLFVMDFDGTLSTELAMINNKKAYYEEMVVMGLPNTNDGKPMPCAGRRRRGFHPERCEEHRCCQGFHEILHAAAGDEREPKGRTGSLGAGHPVDREGGSMVDRHQERSASVALCDGSRVERRPCPAYNGFNPAWGQVNAEQLWGQAHADVIKNGMTPAAAVDKAFRRAETIFAKYSFG